MENKTINFNETKFATQTLNNRIAIVRQSENKADQIVYLTKEEIEKLYETFCK